MSATTDFALALLRAASGPNENFVISPFSLGAALAIVHDGAKEDTQKELTTLLGKTLSPADVSSLYSSLTAAISKNDSGVTTSVANRFFLDKRFKLKNAYASHVEKVFKAGAENINFMDGDGSANYVNAFVDKNTGGMITELVDASFFPNVVALLINAVFFKGEWETQFDQDATLEKPFHGISGNRNEKFMIANKLNTRYSLNDNISVVSLAYKDPSYSLVVLMPSGDFGKWRANLTAESLQGAIENLYTGKINLELPKFKIESSTDGKAALEQCGVKLIFDEDNANLSGISADDLYVTKIIHKAVIEVSEEGTKAAAATAVVFKARSLRAEPPIPSIRFNKPFLYVLTKKAGSTSYPLFIGAKTIKMPSIITSTERLSRKRKAVEEALHAPAVKRPHTIALPWLTPVIALLWTDAEDQPEMTSPTTSSECCPCPAPAPESTPAPSPYVDVSPSPSAQRRVVDLTDLRNSTSATSSPSLNSDASASPEKIVLDLADLLDSTSGAASPFPSDRKVKRESSYNSDLDDSSREPSVSSDDSQMSEHEMSVMDGKKHSDYWKTIGDSQPSDACPECGKWIGDAPSLRRTHYIQCHFDVYFAIIDHMKTESWLGRRLGSWAEMNKCARMEEKSNSTLATRVCVYCKHTDSQNIMYGGRAELLQHIGKVHPTVCEEMMRGYREKARQGEFATRFSRSGMVKNEELHALLMSSPSDLSMTNKNPEPSEEIEIITIE